MKASIYSRDDFKKDYGDGTRGKTFTVEAAEFKVEAENGALTITAQESENYSPQNLLLSTTSIRDIRRNLTLNLTAADLKTIVETAVAAGLIRVSFVVPDRPV